MTTFENARVEAKANIYFDGKVVSHSILTKEGERKTLGLIYPGSYHFGTEAAELMEITSGNCQVKMDGGRPEPDGDGKAADDGGDYFAVAAGSSFKVPANSGFTIKVEDCICEYICSYLAD